MAAQIAGATETLTAPVIWWKYEEGESLVSSKVVLTLLMQMRRLHECYMDAMEKCEFI